MTSPRLWRGGLRALAALMLLGGLLAAETPAEPPPIDFGAVRRSERTIDGRIERYNTESPMEVIGATRGVYLAGTGLLFSIEVSLSPAVGISPFFTRMPPGEVEKIHTAKLGRVPVLRELLLTMLPEMAKAHAAVPENEEIVMGATLFYFPYENLQGLPAQMVVRAKAGDLRKLQTTGDASDAARVAPMAKVTLY
ncbi:MAG: hypothetical protein IT170_01360 [Bryobacterales bacterium]|nr:hypothetical protein [Bryobacterales bacterium]